MHLDRKKFGILLLPVSFVYGTIISIRNYFFNCGILKQVSFEKPVISIGNITVGGTGKTPHVEYLLDLLHKQFNIAVLSRGYKRESKGFIMASIKSSVKQIGDEPRQIKVKFPSVHVAVCSKRVEGIQKLIEKEKELNAIILDDAFQHRYVKPGLSILLIDFNRPLKSDYMLPYGDLRECRHETKRADIIIVTKTPENINPIQKTIFINGIHLFPYQRLYFSTFLYFDPVSVFKTNKSSITFEYIKIHKLSLLLLTGIANPQSLFDHLTNYSKHIEVMSFPDHFDYGIKDIEVISDAFENIKGKEKVILTTEKDAVRLSELKDIPKAIKDHLYFVPLKVKFIEGGHQFNNVIVDFVRKNKTANKLH